MKTTFAHGLGDLAGEDIRRWREDRPAMGDAGVAGWWRMQARGMLDRIGIHMAGERCRGPLTAAEGLRSVPVSDPGSTHVRFRSRPPG